MKLSSDLKPKKILKAIKRAGFLEIHKVGSHVHLHHPDCRRTQVAIHTKPLAKGTLKAILNQTKLSLEELKKLIK
jgi:predicted RNA binding protein YcfA (HicA-like mRNA interferase family)